MGAEFLDGGRGGARRGPMPSCYGRGRRTGPEGGGDGDMGGEGREGVGQGGGKVGGVMR